MNHRCRRAEGQERSEEGREPAEVGSSAASPDPAQSRADQSRIRNPDQVGWRKRVGPVVVAFCRLFSSFPSFFLPLRASLLPCFLNLTCLALHYEVRRARAPKCHPPPHTKKGSCSLAHQTNPLRTPRNRNPTQQKKPCNVRASLAPLPLTLARASPEPIIHTFTIPSIRLFPRIPIVLFLD